MALKNPFDFSGKTVVLTGATGGLGRPITLAFAQAGADIAMCDLHEERLKKLSQEISGGEGRVLASKTDLCNAAEVQAFADQVIDQYGQVDVLANLVGGIIRKPSLEYSLEEWQHVMDINIKACWIACQTFGRIMVKQGQGRIVNFSSNAGIHGVPGYPAYSPAKAGVILLTRVLAVEWGPLGVTANALAPGFTETPFNEDVLTNKERVKAILGRMPMGRILPDDALVGPTLFLASEAADWINGHTINVDAGFNAT